MKPVGKYKPMLLTIMILLVFGFNARKTVVFPKNFPNSTEKDSLQVADAQQKWMHLLNSDIDSLGELYLENAVKINGAGEVLEGALAIVENYRSQALHVDSIGTNQKYTALLDVTISYEIGRFWTPDQTFSHLIIWRNNNGILKRELEFITPIGQEENTQGEITVSREKWMALCNTHDAAKLVSESYTENALYYNHKPLVIGREAITAEYQYMNNPEYELKLNPSIVELVNTNLAFEIGQCSGSYPGNYVIVWQKGEDGQWRVLLDSNI